MLLNTICFILSVVEFSGTAQSGGLSKVPWVSREEPEQPAGGFQEEGVPSVQAGHEKKVLSRP